MSPEARAMEREYATVFPFYQRSFNVAPADPVPVVRNSKDGREGVILRWGLVPFHSKGIVLNERPLIIARFEKLQTWSGWAEPWKRGQRCILPATGFYEWHMHPMRGKNPFYIRLADQDIFDIAGIWEQSKARDGSIIESCALITLPANALLREIHNTGSNPHRMPAILRKEDRDTWLTGSTDQARGLLQKYPSERMVAYEVSRRVNLPKNNDVSLLSRVDNALESRIRCRADTHQ